MKLEFTPIYYDYIDYHGKNYVIMIGRTKENKRVCIIDYFPASFYAILDEKTGDKKIEELKKEIEKKRIELPSRTTKVEKISLEEKNFLGKQVKAFKIFITNHKDSHKIAELLDYKEIIARREYDIPLITKYIKEKEINPMEWYSAEGEILTGSSDFSGITSIDADFCIMAEKIEKIPDKEFNPKILAFDIEAEEFEIGKGEILMISLYSESFMDNSVNPSTLFQNYPDRKFCEKRDTANRIFYKKVLTWKKCTKKQDFVECFSSEAEMLEKFVEYVKKLSPDFLVGYFSDGFDLPYLRARAEYNRIKLSLGLDNSQPSFARGRISSGNIFGIVHIDLFRFIETIFSQYLQSETLGLDEVASELLGLGKKEFEFKPQNKLSQEDWKDFFDYNLHDSKITFLLAEKLWPDVLEISKIIQEPIFDITRNGMSQLVESYILHNLDEYNEIAEKRPIHEEIGKRRNLGKYEGAFVFQPTPGLYENLAFFDFTSMYSSVIVSYNLSLSTFLKKKEKNALEVNLGEEGLVYFSKLKGFFPDLLEKIIEKRKKYKSEYKKNPSPITKARSNAYKLIANAAYGYQGFFGARYYCREAAASTAALSRKNILEVIEKIQKAEYKVVYSDTDSIAFILENKTKERALELLEKINKNLPGIMALELEDFYKRGIWVAKKTTDTGAKKKYALITENNKMKIRGFETVRRDWCPLARALQSKVLELILKQGNEKEALELVKKTIKNLKERKVQREEIMIRTQLKKPLSEYKSITPHVIAAEKMKQVGMPVDIGMLIHYFIAETREKKSLVREKVKLPDEKGEYNLDYYLNHQIIPAVENIFDVFSINIKELAEGRKQTKLSGF
ncbi:hypothetical protein HYW76_00310 [Candidatus Pacearchaeota archaeon]|nr:hypothetical protein [Candidatus Pacearchaeota archaeon]